jgi:cysteine-rich repeat protein
MKLNFVTPVVADSFVGVGENKVPNPIIGFARALISGPTFLVSPPGPCGDGILDPGEQCDDGNTSDGDCCDAGCQFEPAGTLCSDGNLCNGDETCDGAGSCQAGIPPLDCDDGNACTEDSCDAVLDCQNTPVPDGTSCADAMFCNGDEICQAGVCAPGTPVDCDDGVDCTVDACDEVNDVCVNDPDDAFCDDGEFCNGVEKCDPLTDCQPGVLVDCDDGVDCTVDA